MATHSRDFPPSSSKRWLTCPRSVSFINSLPQVPRQSSVYAAEGTAAHTVADMMLSGFTPHPVGTTLDVDGHVVPITHEMIDHGQTYVDAVDELAEAEPGACVIHSEVRVKLDELVGKAAGCMGTCDALIVGKRNLVVVDYKYGRGIEVDVNDNPQIMLYALGAYYGLDSGERANVDTVTLVVVQPRIPGGAPVKVQRMYLLDLLRWGHEVVQPTVARVMSGVADGDPFVPSSECRFCPAAAHCPGLRQRSQQTARQVFGNTPLTALLEEQPVQTTARLTQGVSALSDEDLASALEESALVKACIEAIAAEALQRAASGRSIPRHKIVAKRGVRQWVDETETVLALCRLGLGTEKFVPQVLRSPAQIEKLLPKATRKSLTNLVKVVSSGVSLVKDTDPRPAVATENAASAFGAALLDDE
jgi:hypothetical protein